MSLDGSSGVRWDRNWRRGLWSKFKPLLFKFDPELVHELSLLLIRGNSWVGGGPNRLLSGRLKTTLPESSRLPVVFGKNFLSRVGLAAGFDKNGHLLPYLPDLGFGFAEVGTVTPKPQLGNERPRLFRDVETQSLLNRMGFNNDGAERVAGRVARAKERLPAEFRVGVNIGKNRDTTQDRVNEDYVLAVGPFRDLVDLVIINVSSPNTPGLRSLQSPEFIGPLVQSVREEVESWKRIPRLLLKLSPEMSLSAELLPLLEGAPGWGVDGWVLSNTLAGSMGSWSGGWSGGRVRDQSRALLKNVREKSPLPIVSVGGIDSAEEALLRIRQGADLVEVYTGWIYAGPSLPMEIARAIAEQ